MYKASLNSLVSISIRLKASLMTTNAMMATLSLAQTLRQEGDRRGFYFGAAINEVKQQEANDPLYWDTFAEHFNMGVAENHCKAGYIQ